jgi:hypothetical protein
MLNQRKRQIFFYKEDARTSSAHNKIVSFRKVITCFRNFFLWASINIFKRALLSCFEVILCRLSSYRTVPTEKKMVRDMQYAIASCIPMVFKNWS